MKSRIGFLKSSYEQFVELFRTPEFDADMDATAKDMERGGGDRLHFNLKPALTTKDQDRKHNYPRATVLTRFDEKLEEVDTRIRDYIKMNCHQSGALYNSANSTALEIITRIPTYMPTTSPLRVDVFTNDKNSVTIVERFSIDSYSDNSDVKKPKVIMPTNGPLAFITTTSTITIDESDQLNHALDDDTVYLLDKRAEKFFNSEDIIENRRGVKQAIVEAELNQNLKMAKHLHLAKHYQKLETAAKEAHQDSNVIEDYKAKMLMHCGYYCYYKKDFINAEYAFQDAKRRSPANIENNIGLGKTNLALGKFSAAQRIFQSVMNEYPDNIKAKKGSVKAMVGIGTQYIAKKAYDSACIHFEYSLLSDSAKQDIQKKKVIEYITARYELMNSDHFIYNLLRKIFGHGAEIKLSAANKILRALNGEKVKLTEQERDAIHDTSTLGKLYFEAVNALPDLKQKLIYDSRKEYIHNRTKFFSSTKSINPVKSVVSFFKPGTLTKHEQSQHRAYTSAKR